MAAPSLRRLAGLKASIETLKVEADICLQFMELVEYNDKLEQIEYAEARLAQLTAEREDAIDRMFNLDLRR